MGKSVIKLQATALIVMTAVTGCSGISQKSAPTSADRLTPGIFLDEGRGALPEGFQLRPVIDPGVELTKESEGFVGRLYNDAAGYCSVAYGHLVHKTHCDGSEPRNFQPSVTEPFGTNLLKTDMATAQYAVMTSVRTELTDSQYASLVDFTYNVGSQRLKESTLLRLINARDFCAVPAAWNQWVLAGGKPYPGLVARRKREIELFFDGHVPASKAAPPEGTAAQLIDIRVGG